MKKIIVSIIAVAVLATGAIFVFAQKSASKSAHSFGRGWGHGRGNGVDKMLRGLDLTDEQKAKVKEIMVANRANFEPTMQAMKENHAKIRTLGSDGNFDEAQIEALAAEQGNLVAKMIVRKESVRAQIFAILTPEQKVKAAEMRTKFEGKFEERMKNRENHGDAPVGSEF